MELRYGDDQSEIGQIVLQVPASSPGGQSAVLRCKRPEAGGSGELMWVKISALKLKSILPGRSRRGLTGPGSLPPQQDGSDGPGIAGAIDVACGVRA